MNRKTMVLIHGAWQGSWSWDAWLPELRQRGWHAVALDLPGNGCDPGDATRLADVSLALYVDHVVGIVHNLKTPVVLVGHSGGGITVSQVADAIPESVSAAVYLAGMMLPHGQTYAGLVRQYMASHPDAVIGGIGPHLQWSDDGIASSVPAAAARKIFLQDCDEATAMRAVAKLRRQAEGGRNIAPALRLGRYGNVQRFYVEALQDQSVPLPIQRWMQALSPGALRLSLDCGHVPQLVQPQCLSDLLLPALERHLHPGVHDIL